MNGKSDVLAVLDAEIAKYARGKGMELREARATVERLADALAELSRQHKNVRAAESYPTQNSAATDEADAALAAFRGEQA